MMKGGLYQGFSDGYPGAHSWSATPSNGGDQGNGLGVHTQVPRQHGLRIALAPAVVLKRGCAVRRRWRPRSGTSWSMSFR